MQTYLLFLNVKIITNIAFFSRLFVQKEFNKVIKHVIFKLLKMEFDGTNVFIKHDNVYFWSFMLKSNRNPMFDEFMQK